jgi:hypothetical protein
LWRGPKYAKAVASVRTAQPRVGGVAKPVGQKSEGLTVDFDDGVVATDAGEPPLVGVCEPLPRRWATGMRA